MPVRKGWLPREGTYQSLSGLLLSSSDAVVANGRSRPLLTGFTADVVLRLFKNTALNPSLTLPILLLSHYTRRGQTLAAGHEVALNRLKLFVYLGIARWINNLLSGALVNNWVSSKYEWEKEIVVISGGSDGIGKLVALLLQEKGAKVAILDIQPLTFDPRTDLSSHPLACMF